MMRGGRTEIPHREDLEHPLPWAVPQCKKRHQQEAEVTHRDQPRAHPTQQAEEDQAGCESENPEALETEQPAGESTKKGEEVQTGHWR